MKHLAIGIVFLLAMLAVAQTPTAPKAKEVPAAEPTEAQLNAVPRITVDELKEKMKTDQQLVLIDARAPGAWEQSNVMLPGALRVPPGEVSQHLAELKAFKDRTIVAYCT